VSLVACHLEANGIPTVVMGCARDIVEHCGVPRFLFSDFPLGNSAGRPFDELSQRDTLAQALALFDDADHARTIRASAQRWSDDDAWKDDFLNIERFTADELARRRAEFDAQKAVARNQREPNP
jgi:hypothetical protein